MENGKRPAKPTKHPHVWTDTDDLNLLQQKTLHRISDKTHASKDSEAPPGPRTSNTAEFRTNIGRTPYKWQIEALEKWRASGNRGIVKVVTGAGKTVMAMSAIQDLFSSDPSLRVTIVVPTRVLLNQWYDEFKYYSNISLDLIGRHGDIYKNCFTEGRRVMIWVINSATDHPDLFKSNETVVNGHFLIVDECHRTKSPNNQKIYDVEKIYSLGLSATPEEIENNSPDDASANTQDYVIPDVLKDHLGDIIFDLTFARAVKEGIIPKFQFVNNAVNFSDKERPKYDTVDRQISQLEREIKNSAGFNKYKYEKNANFYTIIRGLSASAQDSILHKKAAKLEQLFNDRKRILYSANARSECLISILDHEIGKGSQIIIFHEHVAKIDELFVNLKSKFDVVLYHSELPNSIRNEALRLYANGSARIILSAKALIEGYDVPATDVGIIVASSSSIRQRIQTMGRVMRKGQGKDSSTIYNIYVHKSSDENIFAKQAWEDLIGKEAITYQRWHGPDNIEILDGPPKKPPLSDTDIEEADLQEGHFYPGAYDGDEYSVDVEGRIYRKDSSDRRIYAESGGLGKKIISIKGSGGVFKITYRKKYVIVNKKEENEKWVTYFIRRLSHELIFKDNDSENDYIEYKFSKKTGGRVEKKDGPRTYFDNSSTGAKKIISAVNKIPQNYGWVIPNKIFVAKKDSVTVCARDPDGNFVVIVVLDNSFEVDRDLGGT